MEAVCFTKNEDDLENKDNLENKGYHINKDDLES